jgi:hypothetical protein
MPAPKDPVKREEWRKKLSDFNKGRKLKPRSAEHCKKISEAKMGHSVSEETRIKIGNSCRGKRYKRKFPFSLEHRKNMSISQMGHSVSEKTREKLSIFNTGKILSEDHCKKIGDSKRGKKHSDKSRRKMSDSHKGERSYFWKGGISFEPYCNKFDKPFKERCRKFFGRICVECGKTEVENGKRLDVHHVNFDKSSCCSDATPLFVALCKSCHIKTNHNREYWEQHFTEMINTKYNGQCYLPKEKLE